MNESHQKSGFELNEFEPLPQSEYETDNSISLVTNDKDSLEGEDFDEEYKLNPEEIKNIQNDIIHLPAECWGLSKPLFKIFGLQVIKGPGCQWIAPFCYITLLITSIPAFNFYASCLNGSWYLLVSNATALLLALAIFKTSMCDPGYVTRKTNPELIREYPFKFYCTKCMVTLKEKKEKKIYHCYDCDRCNYEHDHHCVILGSCIGKYNLYGFYFAITMFLFFNIATYGMLFALLEVKECKSINRGTSGLLLEYILMLLGGDYKKILAYNKKLGIGSSGG